MIMLGEVRIYTGISSEQLIRNSREYGQRVLGGLAAEAARSLDTLMNDGPARHDMSARFRDATRHANMGI